MHIKKTKSADIQLGKKDVLKDSDFESKNIGHRISIVIPEDVLMLFREEAEDKGIGYQTLINQILREYALKEKNLESRVEKLEKILFKKAR